MKKKRLLSLAMAVAMLFGSAAMLPENIFVDTTGISVSAESSSTSGKCGDNAIWELDEKTGKLTISGTGDMWDYRFNYTYNAPGTPWYDYNDDIKTVEISEGITTVGTMAFYSLKRLTSVSISSTVKKINGYAFTYCSSLSSLTFATESKLEFIGDHSFLSVDLTDIVLPEGVTTIEYSAFGNSSSIKSVTLPSTISSINVNAFAHCSNLDNIYMYSDPSKLTWNADQLESGNFKPNKGTKCHVPKEYYATYIEKYAKGEDTDINVTFVVDDCKVTVAKSTGGKVTADKTSVTSGDTVNLTVKPNTGYKLKSLTVKDSNDKVITVTDNAFVMPVDNVTVTAVFEKKKFTVEFVNEDGTVLQTETLAYGTLPEYKGETPTKAKTAQYTYTFKGWDKDIVSVTKATTYKAVFTNDVNKYTVKFVNEDGTVLQTESLAYGTLPEYKGETPAKASTAQYTYTFKGWDKDIVSVTQAATYKAVFTSEVNKYTVKFINEYGTVLQTESLAYGTMPVFKGKTPTKAKTAQYTYTFKGWDKDIVSVNQGATYKAVFTSEVNKYTLALPKNFSVDGTAASSYDYGTTVKFKTNGDCVAIGDVKNGNTVLTASNGVYSVKIIKNTTITAITGVQIPANEATCTEDGNILYYNGSDGNLYKDTKGTKITLAETVIPASGHSYGEPSWTWTDTTGATAIFTCVNDKTHFETVTAAITSETTNATCTADGKTVYTATVKFGGKTYSDTKTVVKTKLGHKFGDWRVKSVDVSKGTTTLTRICSVCKEAETKTENNIERLAGSGRYETAVKISQASFKQADTVVLAYGLNYADALAGVSLAKAMNAPILLTNLKTLPAETLAEIKRLKAKNVIILGGTGAVGAEVETALIKEGFKTERIAGATRFETATKIAGKMQKLNDKTPEEVYFVYAFNSADALSVSAVAAVKGAPVIYLKTTGDLDDATAAYLRSIKDSVKNAYVIGGEGVISNDMMKKAGNALGVTPVRVFGANRFETCVAVNERFADVLDGDMLCVATGMDFPDALAGGVYAAINKAPLFLINGKLKTPKLTDEQKAYLKTKAAARITAFGGVGVVPDNHIADIAKNSI